MTDTVSLHIEVVGLDAMQYAFAKGAQPISFKEIFNFEKTFAEAFAATKEAVHVDTGFLQASGIPSTHFDGDEWEGEIDYARYPGIFELARGDKPTKFHPEGGHFFFNAVEPFIPQLDDDVDSVFRAIFDETAPI